MLDHDSLLAHRHRRYRRFGAIALPPAAATVLSVCYVIFVLNEDFDLDGQLGFREPASGVAAHHETAFERELVDAAGPRGGSDNRFALYAAGAVGLLMMAAGGLGAWVMAGREGDESASYEPDRWDVGPQPGGDGPPGEGSGRWR